MFPPLTSPTANTPGRLVSSRCGCRVSGHLPDRPREFGTCFDEPGFVDVEATIEPAGVRNCAGHDEEVPDFVRLDRRSVYRASGRVEVVVSFQADDFGAVRRSIAGLSSMRRIK